MKIHPLERLARSFMRYARSWRKESSPGNVYVEGVIRGLHEAAFLCRLEVAKRSKKQHRKGMRA